ncbi:MAG: hypothetical protein GX882_09260 [Methanomicrobiales archaeon]|nr:hypothetical protein [Methanomicrobiales archaeon]
MILPGLISPSCVYACTRFRIRRTKLLAREDYHRIMQMSIPGIVAHLGRQEDYKEIMDLAADFSGARLIEETVNRNLVNSFQRAMAIIPEELHALAEEYLTRWDIVNVMAILRSIVFDIPGRRIHSLLVPAGRLNRSLLEHLLSLKTCDEALEALKYWRLYPVLEKYYQICGERGAFARIENELYMNYYAALLGLVASGCPGCRELFAYLRFEIDITNMKNLLRLHCGEVACDIVTIDQTMIPGGRIPIDLFRQLYGSMTEEEFRHTFLQTEIAPLLARAVRELGQEPGFSREDAAELVWQRWHQHLRPTHEIEMAITRIRLRELETLSRRYPFSVLPMLAYLERKRYETANLRAIARGKSFGLPPGRIWQYIVL